MKTYDSIVFHSFIIEYFNKFTNHNFKQVKRINKISSYAQVNCVRGAFIRDWDSSDPL